MKRSVRQLSKRPWDCKDNAEHGKVHARENIFSMFAELSPVGKESATDTNERTATTAEAPMVSAAEAQLSKPSEMSHDVPNSYFLNESAVNAASSTRIEIKRNVVG